MASSKLFLVILAALGVFVPSILATDHVVGDGNGWKLDYNYTEWAAKYEFRVGDKLIFNYKNDSHNVLKVGVDAYKNCTVPNDASPLTSGNDQIPLDSPGKKWYICSFPDHCGKGMRFAIDVRTETGAPAPSPSSAATGVSTPKFFGSMVAVVALIGMALS